jgi:hypothetical protein
MKIDMKLKLTLLTLSFVLLGWVPSAHAQELNLSVTPEPTIAPVDYQLPYPGVLPGHFLYTLKDLRDRVMSLLISNPNKKAEFDLLQSDKRMQATFVLVESDKGKIDVAKQTVTKAQNYFADALEKMDAAKKEGTDNSDLAKRIVLAQKKHVEVLGATEDKLGKEGKKQFADAEKREMEFAKKMKALK